MISNEVGMHVFGSGFLADEPEHLRIARVYQERKKAIQARANAELDELARHYQLDRERIINAYDAEFKQAAIDASLRKE